MSRAGPLPSANPGAYSAEGSPGSRADFRADLNGLRGISVALVLAFHLQLKGAGGGFIGVDVFFVLSGYLMTQIIEGRLAVGRFSYWRFVCERAARIWPALAALVVLLFLVGYWALPPFDLAILAEQARVALLFVSNHHFFGSTGYIVHAGDTHWLLHTWSLSIEWQFYLLYPLLLMGLMKLTTRRRVVALAIAGLMVMSFAFQMLQLRMNGEASFFLLPGRCWELLAGGLVFLLKDELRLPQRSAWQAAASYAGLLLILGGALGAAVWRVRAVGAGPLLLLPVAGAMLILWAGHQRNVVLRNPALQRLGLWSYSVYLWHWPIIIGLRMTEYPLDHPTLTTVVTVIASLLMGGLSYAFVERRGGATRPSLGRLALKPGVSMLLAAGVVLAATVTDGFSFRQRGEPGFYGGYWSAIKPLYFPDDCSNFKKPLGELKTCPVRKAQPARILVIGDSHAEHFYAWFVKHNAGSVDFFSVPECPPVPNFERMQPGYVCKDYAALAWRKAASADYDAVIVAARWLTIGLAGAPYCHQEPGGRCVVPLSLAAKQALVVQELTAAINTTLQAGKKVFVVDAVPEARLRVPERLERELFWYGSARLSVPTTKFVAQTAWFEPLFETFRDVPGFHRVGLRRLLCDELSCRVYDTGLQRPIFIDESHFDPVWIAAQTELFAPLLRKD